MSKTTDYVIERMNEQLDELLGPKPKIEECANCNDMVLMLDEQCPVCGREA